MCWDRSSSYLSHSGRRHEMPHLIPLRVPRPGVARRAATRSPRNRSQHEALPRGTSRRTGAERLSLALGYLVGVHIMAQGGSTRLRTLLQNSSALLKPPKTPKVVPPQEKLPKTGVQTCSNRKCYGWWHEKTSEVPHETCDLPSFNKKASSLLPCLESKCQKASS